MAALTSDRKTDQLGTPDVTEPQFLSFPVAAGAKIYAGAIVCTDANTGYAKPGATSTTLHVWGRCERLADNTNGADGAIQVLVRLGVFYYDSGTAGDVVNMTDVGATVYVIDDHTVGLTNGGGGGTRSKAGVVYAISPTGQVGVYLGKAGLY